MEQEELKKRQELGELVSELEPKVLENSISEEAVGQVETPSDLILGKFKNVDELSKAYQELQRHQGLQSEELGELRQKQSMLQKIDEAWKNQNNWAEQSDILKSIVQKYNKPEYFQDNAFRKLYKEAYKLLDSELDTEQFINLIEDYVASRIYAYERQRNADMETEDLVGSMDFDKNVKSSMKSKEKPLEDMNEEELNELLDKYI